MPLSLKFILFGKKYYLRYFSVQAKLRLILLLSYVADIEHHYHFMPEVRQYILKEPRSSCSESDHSNFFTTDRATETQSGSPEGTFHSAQSWFGIAWWYCRDLIIAISVSI